MKKLFYLLLLSFLLLSGCRTSKASQTELTIACASNLKATLPLLPLPPDLKNAPLFSYGNSAILTQQIKSGAPYDLFISASKEFAPQHFFDHYSWPKPQLAIFTQNSNVLHFLTSSQCQKIAIPNPSSAPIGQSGQKYLAHHHPQLHSKLVYYPSASSTLLPLIQGQVDASITSLSLKPILPPDIHVLPLPSCDSCSTSHLEIYLLSSKPQAKSYFRWLTQEESVFEALKTLGYKR